MHKIREATVKALAILCLLLMAVAAAGGRGPGTLPDPRGGFGEAETLEALVRQAAVSPARKDEIPGLVRALAEAAKKEGLSARASLVSVFPRPETILSMLALDRDVDDFEEAGEGHGRAAAHYRRAVEAAQAFRPLRTNFGALFSAAWEAENPTLVGRLAPDPTPQLSVQDLARAGSLEAPNLRDLRYSHPYALDIFFSKVRRLGEAEYGPAIGALEAGIVVAASGNWRGGAGQEEWRGGGLSPSAGNGVVVYSPGSHRYYSYFHFASVWVQVGQSVTKGQGLGLGGNSGANARKPGHGGHLHLEIFAEDSDEALSGRQIYRMLF